MLYGRRRRLKDLEEAEAKGRSFWTDALDAHARQKLLYAVDRLVGDLHGPYIFDLLAEARQLTLEDLGLPSLSDGRLRERADAFEAILRADEDVVLSLLEAVVRLAVFVASGSTASNLNWAQLDGLRARLQPFLDTVNTILREHRISLDLVDGHFIPFESRELHEGVVVPVLTLLGGRQGFAEVEKAYREALRQLHDGNPENAITDAGTALQVALSTLGCEGNALGPLGVSAQKKGFITGHDRKLIDWVAADRSTKGDTHNAQPATYEDAWLAVHVVGSIILRITGGVPRAESPPA